MLYFQMDPHFTNTSVIVSCDGGKILPEDRLSVDIYIIYFLVLKECRIPNHVVRRVALNQGIFGVTDATSAVISLEQAQ